MVLRSTVKFLPGPLALALLLTVAAPARAAVIPLGPGDFSGASLITFAGIADNTPINGLTVGGVSFSYLVGNVPSPAGIVIVAGGPGITNNIAPPNLVNLTGNVGAVLRLVFPALEERFGYGFAILATTAIPVATTVSLFDASDVLVGTLSAAGAPDPLFTGGFLGLRSTIPFVRADLTFSTLGVAFAVDNIRFAPPMATVPEPASLALLGFGLAGAVARRLRRRHS